MTPDRMPLTAARAHLRNLALEMVSLRRDGKGYRALRFSDADREMYNAALARVDVEVSAGVELLRAVGQADTTLREILRRWTTED